MLIVGDDVEFDVWQPMPPGLGGILVETGKYLPGAETGFAPTPTAILPSFADLPRFLHTCSTIGS
jgi:ribonucleotide monophosphatase NagD (HAD superfamily)